jgi:hypothetical protein
LDFIISRDDVSKDPRITAAIRDFQHLNDPKLSTSKKIACIHSFVGLCNCYRRFIRDYAKEERLLRDLTRKGLVMWNWEQKHYASRALSESEKNYTPTAGEALAIVFGVVLFRPDDV